MQTLIEALSDPKAYDHSVGEIQVRQTHISVVFLAGDFVYKVKKPVDLGFLDFTTLERRRHFCHEEVRLNRRLAPDVYLGVSAIVAENGTLSVREAAKSTADEPVEWAVRMRRLPEDRTMASWIADGTLRPYHVAVVGRRLAAFHREADRGPDVSRWGRYEVVAGNALENLKQAAPHIGHTLTAELHERLTRALTRELHRFEAVIEQRAEAGVPCDTHGDLHLDHIYLFGDRDPPGDLVIIDCIEFNERFRFSDPVADLAFLDMDLRYHGRPDLATALNDAYFDAASDEPGRALLGFYSAYRAAVRGKVAGMRALDPEVPDGDRAAASGEARAHWLLALRLLEPPRRRPSLVLVSGLPGTGKSTLAQALAERADFHVISSDRTRKRLAGMDSATSAAAAYGEGIYASEWNDRTYAALLAEAEAHLLRGDRVIVDASFREDRRRAELLALAERLRVLPLVLMLDAPASRVQERLDTRASGPSDADRSTYQAVAARWQPASSTTIPSVRCVDTSQTPAWSVEQALVHLEEIGVFP